jgi:ribosome assembly protein YihI (activator of Der GTPase)
MYCYYETGVKDIPKSVELSLRYIHKNKDSDDEGTLAPQGTLTTFDRDRLSRLCLALDSHEGIDAETDKLLRQSLKEIDYLLSKFPE